MYLLLGGVYKKVDVLKYKYTIEKEIVEKIKFEGIKQYQENEYKKLNKADYTFVESIARE